MKIGNFEIGQGHTFVIAETCSNIISHLGHLESVVMAVRLSGADALKVQLSRADHFPEAERPYKLKTEFPRELFPDLVHMCHVNGLACGASVFDEEAVRLVKDSGGDFLKLATREWNNDDLWNWCLEDESSPTIRSYDCRKTESLSPLEQELFMACWPEYPAESVVVPGYLDGDGWSSHTSHYKDCLLAVSRGAVAVEKHFALDVNDFERGWSLMPSEFTQMVKDIRWVEGAR